MNGFGIALTSLGVGIAVGAVAVALMRRQGGGSTVHGISDAALLARLEVQAAELRRLADAAGAREGSAEHLRGEVAAARRALEELSVREDERRERHARDSEVIRRLATVLAGGASKGRAGENVLREHLAHLPPGMLVSDLRVNGKVVEFGLSLPDGRRLPIDSKWSALAELEALEAAEPDQVEALGREVERIVALRAKEVAQYLDPALTAPVAVAAVPDAAYAVLRRAHVDAYAKGVVIVPYSTALPIVLFLYSLVQRFGDAGSVRSCLAEVGSLLDGMESVLENKIARAGTMIANSADDLRSHLGKARGSLVRAQAGAGEPRDAIDSAASIDDGDSERGSSVVGIVP